ncbi:MAG TPA: hypothetical protein VNF50_00615 [Acidimicrobiales bacterium]|nr:hypothetical protein [Acidimicrobiales bacterium]
MQPSLPLFSGDGRPPKRRAKGTAPAPAGPVHDRVDGLDGFLVGDEVRVDGLRGRFRCKAFFLDGAVPIAEVFGPLLDGRAGARVPAVRSFPVDRLRRAPRR